MARGNGRSPTGEADSVLAAKNSFVEAQRLFLLAAMINQLSANIYEGHLALHDGLHNGEINFDSGLSVSGESHQLDSNG